MPTSKKPRRQPRMTLHKPSGRARVRINGQDFYLGPFGSSEARDRYEALIAEWLVENDADSRISLTIDGLSLLYVRHADDYYRRPDGEPTEQGGTFGRRCGTWSSTAAEPALGISDRKRLRPSGRRSSRPSLPH